MAATILKHQAVGTKLEKTNQHQNLLQIAEQKIHPKKPALATRTSLAPPIT